MSNIQCLNIYVLYIQHTYCIYMYTYNIYCTMLKSG